MYVINTLVPGEGVCLMLDENLDQLFVERSQLSHIPCQCFTSVTTLDVIRKI